MSRPTVSSPQIVVRHMGFDFADLPRHWLAGDPWVTHMVNGLHFVFPAGERFFIRSVKRYRDGLPPELAARVQAFCGQEAEHQAEHRRAFEAIEAQGYDVQSFLQWYRALAYDEIEPMADPLLRLATTVALEHYTAVFGEFALTDPFLDDCDPRMRALLKWHACEEIEHKSVAFDVLQHVDDRYLLRVTGFVLATTMLLYFWGRGVQHMLAQEENAPRRGERGGVGMTITRFVFDHLPPLLAFLKPGFHPDEQDNYGLAHDYLEEVGRLDQ